MKRIRVSIHTLKGDMSKSSQKYALCSSNCDGGSCGGYTSQNKRESKK